MRKNPRTPTGTFRSEIFIFEQMLDIEWEQDYDPSDGVGMEIYSRDPFTKQFLETLTEPEFDRLTDRLYERSLQMRDARMDTE